MDGIERCIDDEIPFEIPETWSWCRLGTILNIARGGSPRPIKAYLTDSPDGVNWIKIGDTDKGGKYICSTKEKIIKEGVSKSRMVYSGDFLLTNSMSFGRPYILKTDGCIHDGWLVLSDPHGIFIVDYGKVFFKFAYFIQRHRRIGYFATFSWIPHFIRDQTIKSLIARIISRPSGLFVISIYCGYSRFIPFLKQNSMRPSC